jgi:hypothetical protein
MAARRKDREQGIFRRITVRMWGDAKVMALSRPPPCGQVLWVHLLTGEQTDIIPGLCKAGEAAFAEQLGWPLEGFRKAFREVEALGMAKADWDARVVWVPKAIDHNPPASPNVVKSWADAWDRIPECGLKVEAHGVLRAFLQGMSEPFVKAFDEACPKPSAMPCGNQEQEQEQEKLAGSRARARRTSTRSPGPEEETGPVKSDAAGANAATPGGSAPAARDGGDAASAGMAGETRGAAGPARPPRRAPVRFDRDEDRPPLRQLRVANLVDTPNALDLKARLERVLGHGLVMAKVGEESAVAREVEQLLAERTLDDAERYVLATARRRGTTPGSMTWVLEVLRDMPATEELRAPSMASRWDDLLAAMTPAMREEFEAEKRQAYEDIVAMQVWTSEANRLLGEAEERLWAKWNPRVPRPVAAAGGA